MFLFKKIVGNFFLPVPFCLGIFLLGLYLLWLTRRQKAGKTLISVGAFLLVALSIGTVSDALLRPLEFKYPPILGVDNICDSKWVVVLGAGHISDPKVPITSQLHGAGLIRLVEGIRLYRMLPGSKLILSGGTAFDPVPDAKVMADVAIAIGVKQEDLLLEPTSKDTKDQAGRIKNIVGEDKFILVTSAFHMPRAMELFKKHGMRPIPAAANFLVQERQGLSPNMFFPRASALGKAELAFHEYLGNVWATVRGQM